MRLNDEDRTALQLACWQDGALEGFLFFLENVWHPPCAHPQHIPIKDYNQAWAAHCLNHIHCGLPAPRGHRKTTILAEPLAAWQAIHHPDESGLVVSSTPGLARSTVTDIYNKLIREWWADGWPGPGAIWPGLIQDWKEGPPSRLLFSTRRVPRREPSITGAGIFGDGITSYHYDWIIADDVVGEEHARTEGQRQRLRDLWDKKLIPTRSGRKLLTRFFTFYHPNDLNVEDVRNGLPVCDEFKSAIIGGDIHDEGARPLDPDLYSMETLRKFYDEDMGAIAFRLQFMNDAAAAEGAFFKWDWLTAAGEDYRVPERLTEVVLTADPAYNETLGSDYTAVVVAGKGADGHFYLLDWFRGRFDSIIQVAEPIARLHKQWRPIRFGSETGPGANNQLWRQLRAELAEKYALPGLQEIRADKNKQIRAAGLQRHLQSGVWKFPAQRDGYGALRDELLSFPHGAHDDLVDALAHADNWLTGARKTTVAQPMGATVELGFK